jgi:hypothetical protein
MPTLAQILVLVSTAIVARVLIALGMGFVSYASISSVVTFIIARITQQLAGMSGAAVSVVALSGAFQAMSIILSAIMVRITFLALKKIGFIPGSA